MCQNQSTKNEIPKLEKSNIVYTSVKNFNKPHY